MTRKVAFITGAAKRVGREIALYLAQHGYDIAVHYRHSQQEAHDTVVEIQAWGRQAVAVQGDLCMADDAARLMDEVSSMLGAVTALVHNASVFERDDLATLSTESFALHMTVNLLSPLMLTQAFMQQLPEEAFGSVVCLTDGLKGWSISESFLSYSVSKLALEQSMLLLAPTLAPRVRMNVVALGATMENIQDKPDTFEKIRLLTPLERTTSVKDVCHAVQFLLESPMATGQVIDVTGGFALRKKLT